MSGEGPTRAQEGGIMENGGAGRLKMHFQGPNGWTSQFEQSQQNGILYQVRLPCHFPLPRDKAQSVRNEEI